jgi:hypothetical protein
VHYIRKNGCRAGGSYYDRSRGALSDEILEAVEARAAGREKADFIKDAKDAAKKAAKSGE